LDVDLIDGIDKLFLERGIDISAFLPLAHEFGVHTDNFGDLGSSGSSRNNGLITREDRCNERCTRCDGVVLGRCYDEAQVSIRAAS
jgi:hypothetical protein